jgi:hypothetical protein
MGSIFSAIRFFYGTRKGIGAQLGKRMGMGRRKDDPLHLVKNRT